MLQPLFRLRVQIPTALEMGPAELGVRWQLPFPPPLPQGLLFLAKNTPSAQLSPLAGLCVLGEQQSLVCAH